MTALEVVRSRLITHTEAVQARTRGGRGVGLSVAIALIALLALIAGNSDEGSRAVAATTAWWPLSSAGLERTEVGAARIGGSIYVVGGFLAPSTTTAAVERYDIAPDRWRRLRPMPIAVNHPAATAHGGFLYVYGGFTDSSFGPVTAALQRFILAAALILRQDRVPGRAGPTSSRAQKVLPLRSRLSA